MPLADHPAPQYSTKAALPASPNTFWYASSVLRCLSLQVFPPLTIKYSILPSFKQQVHSSARQSPATRRVTTPVISALVPCDPYGGQPPIESLPWLFHHCVIHWRKLRLCVVLSLDSHLFSSLVPLGLWLGVGSTKPACRIFLQCLGIWFRCYLYEHSFRWRSLRLPGR